MTAISTEVLEVLRGCTADGEQLVIGGQLDRKTYEQVNKVLDAAGGKWNRKARAHVFDGPAGLILTAMLESGTVTGWREEGWFPTPPPVVERLLELAALEPGMSVLEPSAGEGAIAGPAAACGAIVDCVELNPRRAAKLREAGFAHRVMEADFLAVAGWSEKYDRVLMNPPFARDADLEHVLHAETFLKPGGRLVSVLAVHAEFRQDRKWAAFRDLIQERGGWVEHLPADSFSQAGTGVRTAVVVLPAGG